MKDLTESPNIGATLAKKLEEIGITNLEELRTAGSIGTLSQLASRDRNGVCLLTLYAIEGAIEGIRWHGLSQERKDELQTLYKTEIGFY